jgi:hypothetical protein
MVMSVGFDNLEYFWQFLCPALGDRSHRQSFKELSQLQVKFLFVLINWCIFICQNHYHKIDCGVFQVKTGPFAEHSNVLWGISGVQFWSKVNGGLMKMYKAEVSSKFLFISLY